jgi:hypothetical protein
VGFGTPQKTVINMVGTITNYSARDANELLGNGNSNSNRYVQVWIVGSIGANMYGPVTVMILKLEMVMAIGIGTLWVMQMRRKATH